MARLKVPVQRHPSRVRRPRSKLNSRKGTTATAANGGASGWDAKRSSSGVQRTKGHRATKTEVQNSEVLQDPVAQSSLAVVLHAVEAEQSSNSEETGEGTTSDDQFQIADDDYVGEHKQTSSDDDENNYDAAEQDAGEDVSQHDEAESTDEDVQKHKKTADGDDVNDADDEEDATEDEEEHGNKTVRTYGENKAGQDGRKNAVQDGRKAARHSALQRKKNSCKEGKKNDRKGRNIRHSDDEDFDPNVDPDRKGMNIRHSDDEDFDANVDPVQEGNLDEEYFSAKELDRLSTGTPYNLPKKRGDVIFYCADHQKRFEKLKCRPFKPSRLCCRDTLQTLGIYRDVTELLSRVHWVKFAFLSNNCYKDMTLEFLSSFHLQIDGDDQYPPYTLTFQLLNRRFAMRYEKFAKIFGFSYDGLVSAHEDYDKQKFWSDIGGKGLFKAGRSKGSDIQNKALRYIHRFMSYSVECRAESNTVVNKNELFFLWCMVNGWKVQTGKYFLRHLQDMATRPKGTIMVGAFVTHIALELKLYDPATYEPPSKVDCTDQNLTLLTLERMDMIKRVRGGYVFIDEGAIVAVRSRKRERTDESDDSIQSGDCEIANGRIMTIHSAVKAFASHLPELAAAIADHLKSTFWDTGFRDMDGAIPGVYGSITTRLCELDNAVEVVRQEVELVRNNVADLGNHLKSR